MGAYFAIILRCSPLSSRLTALLSYAILNEVLNIHRSGVLTVLFRCYRLVPRETAAVSAHVLCAPYNYALVYSVTSFQAAYVGCMCV